MLFSETDLRARGVPLQRHYSYQKKKSITTTKIFCSNILRSPRSASLEAVVGCCVCLMPYCMYNLVLGSVLREEQVLSLLFWWGEENFLTINALVSCLQPQSQPWVVCWVIRSPIKPQFPVQLYSTLCHFLRRVCMNTALLRELEWQFSIRLLQLFHKLVVCTWHTTLATIRSIIQLPQLQGFEGLLVKQCFRGF